MTIVVNNQTIKIEKPDFIPTVLRINIHFFFFIDRAMMMPLNYCWSLVNKQTQHS